MLLENDLQKLREKERVWFLKVDQGRKETRGKVFAPGVYVLMVFDTCVLFQRPRRPQTRSASWSDQSSVHFPSLTQQVNLSPI